MRLAAQELDLAGRGPASAQLDGRDAAAVLLEPLLANGLPNELVYVRA